MTTTIGFTLRLHADAEPGSGFATEVVDDIVPRDAEGHPVIPGSHLKGLLRDSFGSIAALRGWPGWLEDSIFGVAGEEGADGEPGLARIPDTTFLRDGTAPQTISTISRTAVSPHGTALDTSLRTTERVHAGACFRGAIRLRAGATELHAMAVQLALLATTVFGGNRSRGAGRCVIEVDGCHRTPSALLRELDARLKGAAQPANPAPIATPAAAWTLGSSTVVVELTFVAQDPVCVPLVPLTATNVLRSGFAIAASAVQGAILHRLNSIDHALATACFEHPLFRAWPLLPCASFDEDPGDVAPIWTSLTHRMGKLASGAEGKHEFRDAMIEPYDWRTVAEGSPLKAADGVLLANADRVRLWRAADMPRRVSAHVGLGGDEPALFTVDAMAPMTYRGWASIPTEAVSPLLESFDAQPDIAFGKAKTVRGGGRLMLRRDHASWGRITGLGADLVFIVQSPIELQATADLQRSEAGSLLKTMVEGSGWGCVDRAQATVEIRFGWNRHAIGRRVSHTNRLQAAPVLAPGSVFRLDAPPDDLATLLLRGIGTGRERGFGAVLPHPGRAQDRYLRSSSPPKVGSRDDAGRHALALIEAGRSSGLRASQVSRLVEIAAAPDGHRRLREFLTDQKMRPPTIWHRWKPVRELVVKLADQGVSSQTLERAFQAWRDATVATRGGDL